MRHGLRRSFRGSRSRSWAQRLYAVARVGGLLAVVVSSLAAAPASPPTETPTPTAIPASPPQPKAPQRATVVWLRGGVTVAPVALELSGEGLELGLAPGTPSVTPSPVAVGEPLAEGDALELGSEGELWLLMGGDTLVVLRGPGRCVLRASLRLECRGVARRRERLEGFREIAPPASLVPRSLLPPGPPVEERQAAASASEKDLVIQSPRGPMTRSTRPELRWRWGGAEARFDLELSRVSGEGEGESWPVERWRGLSGSSLTLWRPLSRGGRYRLRVSLVGDESVAAEAVFAVLPEVDERALARELGALERLARRSPSPRPELSVLRARLLESFGLPEEARRVWAALALLHPKRVELLDRLREPQGERPR